MERPNTRYDIPDFDSTEYQYIARNNIHSIFPNCCYSAWACGMLTKELLQNPIMLEDKNLRLFVRQNGAKTSKNGRICYSYQLHISWMYSYYKYITTTTNEPVCVCVCGGVGVGVGWVCVVCVCVWVCVGVCVGEIKWQQQWSPHK